MIKLKTIFITAVAVIISSQAIARDQIKIVGSSTVYPYSTVVAERFGKQGKFKTPVVESTGTGGGFKSFCGGVGVEHPDMTGASRAIKKDEMELCIKNGVTDIIELPIGNDGLTFAHSIKAKDVNFTKAQLWKAIAHDVVIDGKLVKTCLLPGTANVNNNSDVYVTPQGGFDGWTSKFQYYPNSLNPQEVWNIYSKGYGGQGWFNNTYSLQVSLLENGAQQSSFTI